MAPAEMAAVSILALSKEKLKTRTPDSMVAPLGRTNCGSRLEECGTYLRAPSVIGGAPELVLPT